MVPSGDQGVEVVRRSLRQGPLVAPVRAHHGDLRAPSATGGLERDQPVGSRRGVGGQHGGPGQGGREQTEGDAR